MPINNSCRITSIALMILSPSLSLANYQFDAAMFGDDIDISLLEQGQPEGLYLVEVVMNGSLVDIDEFYFKKNEYGLLHTCISENKLLQYGIKIDDYPLLFSKQFNDQHNKPASQSCADISAIPSASQSFDFYNQQLKLSIPNIALKKKSVGIADEMLWDDGISAFRMNYRLNFNGNKNVTSQGHDTATNWSAFLEPGINIGAWRLRNSTNWSEGKWQSFYSYAEQGLNSLRSKLILGERFSSSMLFDGVPMTGIILATDDDMLPYEQRGYSPVVRGSARSQAIVEVRQNGFLLFSTTVAPGPFQFNDLANGLSGGDLEVTIIESEGPPQFFTVTYAIPAISLQEGLFKYDLAVGKYRPADYLINKNEFGQVTLMYGLPFGITAYGGSQFSSSYNVNAIGVGSSLGYLGALSIDYIFGDWQRNGQPTEYGYKNRQIYNKFFESTESLFILENNLFSSTGFMTLAEVLDTHRQTSTIQPLNISTAENTKSQTSITMSQSLGHFGTLNLSGHLTRYYSYKPKERIIRTSYKSMYKKLSVSVDFSTSINKNTNTYKTHNDQQLGIRLSYPIDLNNTSPLYVSYQFREDNSREKKYEIGLRSYAYDRRLSWDFREQIKRNDSSNEYKLINIGWSDKYGVINSGYGYGRDNMQWNINATGGVIAYNDGVTLGQPLGRTTGLVIAPDAEDIVVGSWPGVRTDSNGRAIISSLTPYQFNSVSLDPINIPEDVTLSQTEAKVVPTSGAIIPVQFSTKKGTNILFQLSRTDGSPIPFGALVTEFDKTKNGLSLGIVGEHGETYLMGIKDKGTLLVRWGKNIDQQCLVNYRQPENSNVNGGAHLVKQTCI